MEETQNTKVTMALYTILGHRSASKSISHNQFSIAKKCPQVSHYLGANHIQHTCFTRSLFLPLKLFECLIYRSFSNVICVITDYLLGKTKDDFQKVSFSVTCFKEIVYLFS